MKNIFIILAAILLLGSACDEFLSVNEKNPNNASEVAPKLILPDALAIIARNMNTPGNFDFTYLWYGTWSVSAGYSQPTNLTQYKLPNNNYNANFNNAYVAGSNLTVIEKASTDPKDVNYLAIAKIMKAYIFQTLVDCYGDVPYFDAFKTDEGLLKPTYTPQQEIYEDLVVKLDEAMDLLQNAPADANELTAGSDIIFHGDMDMWLKFANTLKLRILIHQSDMAGRDGYIQDNIDNTASIGYLGVGESALANPGYLVSTGKMNPFYEAFYQANGSQGNNVNYYFAGKDLVDYLKSTNDPRLSKYFKNASSSPTLYDGNYFGTPGSDLTIQSLTSQIGYSASDPTCSVGGAAKSAPILTDFESLFIQAEAAERGFITGDAATLYNAAVLQSFLYMGRTAGEAATFLVQDAVRYIPGSLDGLLTQKWVALTGIAPVELWTDYRRSGIPTFLHFSSDPQRDNDTPCVRLPYPQGEIDTNNDNLLKVGDIDLFSSKIFWQNR